MYKRKNVFTCISAALLAVLGLLISTACEPLPVENPPKAKMIPQQKEEPDSKPAIGAVPEWLKEFDKFEKTLPYPAGIAVAALGGEQAYLAGRIRSGVAWSTMKVPVAIVAVQRAKSLRNIDSSLRMAITQSNNDSAHALFRGYSNGDRKQGYRLLEEVLIQAKSPSLNFIDKGPSPDDGWFGLTEWPLDKQVLFMANMHCLKGAEVVWEQMGNVAANQRWGLGNFPKAHFKGGWGADEKGIYTSRQMGVVEIEGGPLAVALITYGGSLEMENRELSQISEWLKNHAHKLPVKDNGCRKLQ